MSHVDKTTNGYVYLIQRHDGLWKIGQTANPTKRLQGYRDAGVKGYEHLIECEDRYEAERYWHRQFAKKRVQGEWFALLPQDIDEIKLVTHMKRKRNKLDMPLKSPGPNRIIAFRLLPNSSEGQILAQWEANGYSKQEIMDYALLKLGDHPVEDKQHMDEMAIEALNTAIARLKNLAQTLSGSGGFRPESKKDD